MSLESIASDADGSVVSYAWGLFANYSVGFLTYSDPTSRETSVTVTKLGVHSIKATVTDDDGNTRSGTAILVLNRDPSATAYSMPRVGVDTGTVGGTVLLIVNATDPDVPADRSLWDPREELYLAYTYHWSVDSAPAGSTLSLPATTSTSELTLTDVPEGNYSIGVVVHDPWDATAPKVVIDFGVVTIIPKFFANPTFMLSEERTHVDLTSAAFKRAHSPSCLECVTGQPILHVDAGCPQRRYLSSAI